MKKIIVKLFTLLYVLRSRLERGFNIKNSQIFLCVFKLSRTSQVYIHNSYLSKCNYFISGYNNKLNLCTKAFNMTVRMKGEGNSLIIEDSKQFDNVKFYIKGKHCTVRIGQGTSINGAYLLCMGHDVCLDIGEECMLADEIDIWTSDSHPIFYNNNPIETINPSQSVIIGNHVWIGKKVSILKGVTIGDNSIIGMGSIVTKDIPPNSLVVGNPSRIIKSCINWDRNHITL